MRDEEWNQGQIDMDILLLGRIRDGVLLVKRTMTRKLWQPWEVYAQLSALWEIVSLLMSSRTPGARETHRLWYKTKGVVPLARLRMAIVRDDVDWVVLGEAIRTFLDRVMEAHKQHKRLVPNWYK